MCECREIEIQLTYYIISSECFQLPKCILFIFYFPPSSYFFQVSLTLHIFAYDMRFNCLFRFFSFSFNFFSRLFTLVLINEKAPFKIFYYYYFKFLATITNKLTHENNKI